MIRLILFDHFEVVTEACTLIINKIKADLENAYRVFEPRILRN